MSKTCIVDCRDGSSIIREMTAEEELRWQADLAAAAAQRKRAQVAAEQHAADLKTLRDKCVAGDLGACATLRLLGYST